MVRLQEILDLPPNVSAYCNNKSSTGRIGVFLSPGFAALGDCSGVYPSPENTHMLQSPSRGPWHSFLRTAAHSTPFSVASRLGIFGEYRCQHSHRYGLQPPLRQDSSRIQGGGLAANHFPLLRCGLATGPDPQPGNFLHRAPLAAFLRNAGALRFPDEFALRSGFVS